MTVSKLNVGAHTGAKAQDGIWTRVVIDPVAGLLVRPLVRMRWVTPNRVTVVAGVFAIATALAFMTGRLILGGLLFQVRFLVDCLDGRLARIRGTTSHWGASLDLTVDAAGIAISYAALSWFLVDQRGAPPALMASVLTTQGVYAWSLAHRKSITGGRQRDWMQAAPLVDRTSRSSVWNKYSAFMTRHGIVPIPYAVELEALSLTLLPIAAGVFDDSSLASLGLWVASAFYCLAFLANALRTWRLTDALDKESA